MTTLRGREAGRLERLERIKESARGIFARDPALSPHALEQSHDVRSGGVTAQALGESACYVRGAR